MLHNGVTVKSHGVVTHDYLCRVEEHLKGHLNPNCKHMDWSITEVQKLCKQVGEQEKKVCSATRESRLEENCQRQARAGKDAAEHNAVLQQLDQRLALLESIVSELVSSSGVCAGVIGSALSGSVPERPKAESPEKSGSDSDSL